MLKETHSLFIFTANHGFIHLLDLFNLVLAHPILNYLYPKSSFSTVVISDKIISMVFRCVTYWGVRSLGSEYDWVCGSYQSHQWEKEAIWVSLGPKKHDLWHLHKLKPLLGRQLGIWWISKIRVPLTRLLCCAVMLAIITEEVSLGLGPDFPKWDL